MISANLITKMNERLDCYTDYKRPLSFLSFALDASSAAGTSASPPASVSRPSCPIFSTRCPSARPACSRTPRACPPRRPTCPTTTRCASPGPASSFLIPATPRTSSPASATPSPSSGVNAVPPSSKKPARSSVSAPCPITSPRRNPAASSSKTTSSATARAAARPPSTGRSPPSPHVHPLDLLPPHRQPDALYLCINDFIEPKLELTVNELE